MIDELGKDLEGSDHGLIEVLSLYLPGGFEENQEKPQSAGVPVVARTELCPNTVRSITTTRFNVYFLLFDVILRNGDVIWLNNFKRMRRDKID
jgi:hypothetical protein